MSQAQEPLAPAAPALPAGIQLNGVSLFSGSDWMELGGRTSQPSISRLWLWTAGASADVGASFGQRTRLSIDYRAGYNYNQRFSILNGVDHEVSIDLRTNPERHTVFGLSAGGASGPISDALFDPRYALQVAQQASSINDLTGGLNQSNAGAVLSSPIALALSGGRRRTGAVFAEIRHTHSRRLTSFLHSGIVREIHSLGGEQQVIVRYPNVTTATADAGARYLLTRRTAIVGTLTYARSYTQLYRMDWRGAGLTLERQIGRRSFAALQGGYFITGGIGAGGAGTSSYTVAGTFGTMKGNHTLTMTVRRGISDLHGLEADATSGAEMAWNWAPHASSWSWGSSVGYERVRGTFGLIQAWVAQAYGTHRLSAHFRLLLSAAYMTDNGRDLLGLTREGVRLSIVWTPGLERPR